MYDLAIDKAPATWGELAEALTAAGFAADEYLSESGRYQHPDFRTLELWGAGVRWISCFWVVGGSEGYYCHIERQRATGGNDGNVFSELMLLGKFWDWQRAEACAVFAQRLVNM